MLIHPSLNRARQTRFTLKKIISRDYKKFLSFSLSLSELSLHTRVDSPHRKGEVREERFGGLYAEWVEGERDDSHE